MVNSDSYSILLYIILMGNGKENCAWWFDHLVPQKMTVRHWALCVNGMMISLQVQGWSRFALKYICLYKSFFMFFKII